MRIEAETERDLAATSRRQLQAELEAGALDLRDARRLLARCGTLTHAEAEHLAAMVTDLEVADVLRRYDRFDEGVHAAAGAEFVAMSRLDKRPLARNAVLDFWGGILIHLEHQDKPDLDLYRQGLTKLEDLFGEARGYRSFLDKRRNAFDELLHKTNAVDVRVTR